MLDYLTHPLFGAVLFLVGGILGFAWGRFDRAKEWATREQLIRKSQPENGCWVKAQINMQDQD